MTSPRLARVFRVLLLSFAAGFVLAPGAVAAPLDSSISSRDLHSPQGALVAPDGSLWVADHTGGFCRTSAPTWQSAGTLEHPLVASDPGPRTCLGGLLPDAQPGPDAAIDPILVDPDGAQNSGDEVAFIADTATRSAHITRARWNKVSGLFEFDGLVTLDADPLETERPRPMGMTVDAQDRLYVVFQRSQTVQRVTRGWTNQPLVETVARIQSRRAGNIAARTNAAGRVTLYISEEAAGLTKVDPDPVTQPLTVAGPQLGTFVDPDDGVVPNAVEAMHYDATGDVLYAATANAGLPEEAGIDRILRYDVSVEDRFVPPAPADYLITEHATGFSSPAGLDGGADGTLLVTDDPGILGDVEQLGTGLLRVVGRPVAHVTGPEHTDNDPLPVFDFQGEGDMQCWIGARDAAAAPAPCENGPRTADGLADGAYVAAVRSGAGVIESHAFEVDTVDPAEARIVSPAAGTVDADADGDLDPPVVSRRPFFEYASSEDGIEQWLCSRDGGAFEPCSQGRMTVRDADGSDVLHDWTAGDHTLAVKAVDDAGNESPASETLTFTVDTTLRVGKEPVAFPETRLFSGSTTRIGEGLHISTGAITDPNGRTWVSDHEAGFCRMKESTLGVAVIDHPETTRDVDATRTCLGGLRPFAAPGADASGAPAFLDLTPADPSSGDEWAFIPDGNSKSNLVYRAKWDPETGLFTTVDTISVTEEKPRPTAVTLGPDGALYVITQEEDTVERFVNPTGPNPRPQVVGHALSGEAIGIAAGRATPGGPTVIYLGEGDAVTRFTPRAAAGNTAAPTATEVPWTLPERPAPNVVDVEGGFSGVAYDLQRDQLYVGTSYGETQADEGEDRVHRIDVRTGAVDPDFSTGHSMIGGLGLRPDGKLYVLDDAALLDPAEPLGVGRMFLAGLPAAHVTEGPMGPGGATSSADRHHTSITRPAFRVTGTPGATLECAFALPGTTELVDEDWGSCTNAGDRFDPGLTLAEGTYVVAVRATVGTARGLVEAHRFTVDTTAPADPTISQPVDQAGIGAGLAPLSAQPSVDFASSEPAYFECRLYGEGEQPSPWESCAPGRLPSFDDVATHTLDVRAIDRAGNRSAGFATSTFRVDGALPTVVFTQPQRSVFTNAASYELTWELSETMQRVECRITPGQVAPGGDTGWADCPSQTAVTLERPDGTYLVEVRATDASSPGNLGPVNDRLVTFDRTGPTLTITGPTADQTIDMPGVLSWTASETVDAECSLDGGAFQACASPTRLERLAPGVHTIEIRAADLAGNPTSVTRTFRVSNRPPADDGGGNDGLNELRGRGGGGGNAAAPLPAPVPPAPGTGGAGGGTGATAPVVDPVRLALTFDVPQLLRRGLPLLLVTKTTQPVVQVQVVQTGATGTAARAAAAKRKVVATVRKRFGKAGAHRLVLRQRSVRRLKPGRYMLVVRAGRDRRHLEHVATERFTVRRKR